MSKSSYPPGPSIKTAMEATPEKTYGRGMDHLLIVGIGASTGGMLGVEPFLKHVPEAAGMEFVIVQHPDPNRKGTVAELLQRKTGMKVFEGKNGTRVRPRPSLINGSAL